MSVFEPEVREDAHGRVVLSAIETYGDTIHVLWSARSTAECSSLVMRRNPTVPVQSAGLEHVDHMSEMGWGEMNTWVDFYARAGICPTHLLG